MKTLLNILFFIPLLSFAQFYDSFDDGDFTQNPQWTGSDGSFVINDSKQLQLNATGEGQSHLVTFSGMTGETEWRFWIKLAFSPSSNNFARIYLASDLENIGQPVNGYFLQFGESGTSDAIELFRQEGDVLTSVCRGTEGLIASSFQMNVRVRKDQTGFWQIEVDESGMGAYTPEASGPDNTILQSACFGLLCKYTSSNSTKFYFDNFYCGPFVFDTEPPEIQKTTVISKNQLSVLFSEAIQKNSAENIQNYQVSNGIENPITAVQDEQNKALVFLEFDRDFPNGTMNTITISNIADLAGNIAGELFSEFYWFKPSAHEIQINEIMADPTPPVNLPEHEYIELHNLTGIPVDLTGWILMTGTTEKVFDTAWIDPGSYLIVGDEDAAEDFSTYSLSFYGFSSFSLTNSGQLLVLMNPDRQVISFVNYSDAWYGDPNKSSGGWSLEQIDPENPCGGSGNWRASMNPSGGSPGLENSVVAENPDILSPTMLNLEILSPVQLTMYFSEPMDSTLISQNAGYEVDHEIGRPILVEPVWPDYAAVNLFFNDSLKTGFFYTLQITSDFLDCSGNPVDKSKTLVFGLPQTPHESDIVINEVLYNPRTDFVEGVDFVEIYNRSSKMIDLSKLVIATEDETTGELESPKPLSEKGLLLFPETYLVLTSNPEIVKEQYFTENPDGFFRLETMPAFNNDKGVVILATNGFEVIDRFQYSDEMQFPLLTATDGVSLERLDMERPATDPSNWHSAASSVGYATPAYKNSQSATTVEVKDPITIDPEVFSPDNDGHDDVLNIFYQFSQPGYMASVTIFDDRGRLVRHVANNELLSSEGSFSWDGINNENEKAGLGIYIVFIEIFDLDGNVEKYKKTAVLGGFLR